MPLIRLSPGLWKWLIVTAALAIGMLMLDELSYGWNPQLRDGRQGSLGVRLADQLGVAPDGQGTHFLRIEQVDQDSPLAAAGAARGDRLRFNRPLDRWRKFAPRETVGLTLYHAGAARRLEVQAVPADIPLADRVDYWGRAAVALPALLFGVLVGMRQPVGRAYRCLTLTFLALGTAVYFSFTYAPPGALATAGKPVQLVLNGLTWFCCAGFALGYHPYPRTALRRGLTRVYPWYRALAFATAAYSCWFAFGNEAPMLFAFSMGTVLGGLVLITLSLVDGWRHCTGEARQRHRWLLLAMGLGGVPALLAIMPALTWSVHGARVTVVLYFAGQLAMFTLLAYAVLRHQVFNFPFAVSRALVFGTISSLLVFVLASTETVLAPLMHDEVFVPSHPRLLLDAALTVAVFLCFNKVHDWIERHVERILFRRWHDLEHALRAYVAEAAHAESEDQLLASLTGALDSFTGTAGAAVYLRRPGGAFALAASTLDGAAAAIGADDALAVALRTDLAPVHPAHAGAPARGELALPMCHRAALLGFVVLGCKPHGESYRPDESAVLSFAVQQVGLDLHALRVGALEAAVRRLAADNAHLGHKISAAAGRRVAALGRTDAAAQAGAKAAEVAA